MSSEAHRRPLPRWRLVLVVVAALLLASPAVTVYRQAAWSVHTWSRLRHAHRAAPDSAADAENRALVPYLPREGPIGFSVGSVAALPPDDQLRIEQFLQYSLAPRVIVLSTRPTFVVEYVAPGAPASLAHDPAFALVASSGERLRLFRRIGR
jgi:hypothetical protein